MKRKKNIPKPITINPIQDTKYECPDCGYISFRIIECPICGKMLIQKTEK